MLTTITYSFLATVIIELSVLKLLGEKSRKILISSIVINAFTNIPLNIYLLLVNNSSIDIAIGELLVLIVETFCYFFLLKKWSRAFWYSFICNSISFLVGLLFQLIVIYINLK